MTEFRLRCESCRWIVQLTNNRLKRMLKDQRGPIIHNHRVIIEGRR